jgi:hypothetical protein
LNWPERFEIIWQQWVKGKDGNPYNLSGKL